MTPLRRAAHRWGPLLFYVAACGLLLSLLGRQGAPLLRALLAGLPFGLGLFCGFALAVAAGTLWVFVAGPMQELIQERFFDPPQPGPMPTPTVDGPQGVLVSDLHIDTWGLTEGGDIPNARRARLLGLLAAVKADPRVNSFLLNGDLMDIPLHPDANAPEPEMLRLSGMLAEERGVLLARYDSILGALLDLTRPDPASPAEVAAPVRRAVFQTGNHDVGVSGLRYVRPELPPFLPPVQAVWNPSLLIQTDAEGSELPCWVYVEHGHRWDPLLWLYMRYALLDILRAGHRRQEAQLLSGMQRAGKAGMGAQTVGAGPLPPAPAPGTSANHFPGDQPGLLSTLVRLRYRQAARRLGREFRSRQADPQAAMRVRTLLMGHTHHPDRYVFPGGLLYINSGDWSGYTDHCAYCVLDPDGSVRGPFQWEDAGKAEFGPRPAYDGDKA